MSNDKQLHCYVCLKSIVGRYYVTEWGLVCERCYQPQNACFTCGRQMNAAAVLRLADSRVCCADCAATAVYKVDENLVLAVKRRLPWFPRKHINFGTVDVRQLHAMVKVKNGTAMGLCNTTLMHLLTYVTVLHHRILILFGLPREMCQAALVHELFHAWIHENVPPGRHSEAEVEWLCEHMAFNFLRSTQAQDHWIKKVEGSRDQYPEVPGLKSCGAETIVRSLKR